MSDHFIEIKVLSVAFVATISQLITEQIINLDFVLIWKFLPGTVSIAYVIWRWVFDIINMRKK